VTDLGGWLLVAFLAHCVLVAYLVRLHQTGGKPLIERAPAPEDQP
jgi:hypothetical protein